MTARQIARRQRKRNEREYNKFYNFAGWGICGCGRGAYLVGKSYDGKKCPVCLGVEDGG